MKKILFFASLLTLTGLLLVTTQVLAGPPVFAGPNKAPTHTPPPVVTVQVTPGTPPTSPNPDAPQGKNNSQGRRLNYRGSITAVSASSLTLDQDDGSPVTFTLNADTRVKIPTLGPKATSADLNVGMRVNVQAIQESGGGLTARIVLAVPGKPGLIHRVGTVTQYQAGSSITITTADGSTYTFSLDAQTKILPSGRTPSVGAVVTVIAPRNPSTGGWRAVGIVVHPS